MGGCQNSPGEEKNEGMTAQQERQYHKDVSEAIDNQRSVVLLDKSRRNVIIKTALAGNSFKPGENRKNKKRLYKELLREAKQLEKQGYIRFKSGKEYLDWVYER